MTKCGNPKVIEQKKNGVKIRFLYSIGISSVKKNGGQEGNVPQPRMECSGKRGKGSGHVRGSKKVKLQSHGETTKLLRGLRTLQDQKREEGGRLRGVETLLRYLVPAVKQGSTKGENPGSMWSYARVLEWKKKKKNFDREKKQGEIEFRCIAISCKNRRKKKG